MSEEKFKTCCSSCIFAIRQYEKQTGCKLGRLKKFTELNRANLDDQQYCYIIDGICNTCRGKRWAETNGNNNLIDSVLKEIQLSVDIVIYSIETNHNTIQCITKTVKACLNQQDIQPKKIVIVVKNNNINYKQLYDILQELIEPYELPFQLVRIIDNDADINSCVAMGIDKCTSQFTAVFNTEHQIPSDFIKCLHKLINEDLQRIIMIKPTFAYGGMILQTGIFNMLGKNYNMPIFTKVEKLAQEQNKQNLIYTWDQLCNHK